MCTTGEDMTPRMSILCLVCTSFLLTLSSGEVKVTPNLYATVELPCTFPFIRKLKGLTIVWEKVENSGRRLEVHKFMAGQDELSNQDSRYSRRTQLSKEISKGNLTLTLTEVAFGDEGIYYCRAANRKGHGDKKVDLSIAGLEVHNLSVTFHGISQHLKCVAKGKFRDPHVNWYDRERRDLSDSATLNVTTLSDGRKMVESVLELDVDRKDHYFCYIEEGGLKTRVVRAAISDGVHSVRVDDEL